MNLWILASQILPLFVYPVGACVVLMLLGLWSLSRRRYWLASGAFFLGGGYLLLAATPMASNYLLSPLENQYPSISVEDSMSADAVVILGGALGAPTRPRTDIHLTAGSNRVRRAARLFLAGKAPVIIVSGGNVFEQSEAEPESIYIKQLLIEWGVDAAAIVVEPRSRNTHENAVETKAIIDVHGLREVLLVTSAMHMPRAAGVFLAEGIKVIASPTDFRISESNHPAILDWLPSAESLATTTAALKEYIGIQVYRMRGWIPDN